MDAGHGVFAVVCIFMLVFLILAGVRIVEARDNLVVAHLMHIKWEMAHTGKYLEPPNLEEWSHRHKVAYYEFINSLPTRKMKAK